MSGTDGPHRRPGVLLLLGLLKVPIAFGWLILRPGYPRSLRRAVLIYALFMTFIPFVGRVA